MSETPANLAAPTSNQPEVLISTLERGDFVALVGRPHAPIMILGDSAYSFQPEFPLIYTNKYVVGTVMEVINIPHSEMVAVMVSSYTRSCTVRIRVIMAHESKLAMKMRKLGEGEGKA